MQTGAQSREVAAGWSVSRRAVDLAVGLAAFAIGVVVMLDTWRLGAGWAGGSPQSGYFPFRIGAIICIVAAVIVFRAWRRPAGPGEIFVTWQRLRLVLAVLVPTLAFIVAIQFLGLYVAAALFIGAFMRVGGRYGWTKTVLVGAGTAAVLVWLFEIQFLVPLPKGPLEAMLGY